MANKTKKRTNKCRTKTIKKKDVTEIKKINSRFNTFVANNLTKKTTNDMIKEFKSRILLEYSTTPCRFNKYSYFYKIKQKNNYGAYYYTDSGTDKTQVLVDCETMAKNKTYFNMNEPDISNDESFIAFSVDYTGGNITTVYIKNILTGHQTIITKKGGGGYCFSPESKILYYITCDSAGKPYKLFAYNIYSKKNTLIYTEYETSTGISVYKTSDNLHCLLDSSTKIYSNVYELKDTTCTKLYKHQTDKLYVVDHFMNKWYVLVDDSKSRIMETLDFKTFTTAVKHIKDVSFEYFLIHSNKLIIGSREKGFNYLTIKDLCTNKIIKLNLSPIRHEITIPGLSNMNIFSKELVVDVSTFLQPSKVISIDLDTFKTKDIMTYNPSTYNPKKYTESVIQVTDTLHMTVLYKTSLYKKNMKCLIHGYGSYGAVEDPEYNYTIQSLLDRGFLYCFAHIRGGGYMGKKWYDDGKLLNKMNSFHDFIACTEFLINKNYTSSDKLAIYGRSAGGLLIGAVINMRPELYKLAILGVPFVDVLSTMSDKCSPLTTEEYYEFGNPSNKSIRNYMQKYSPVDNIDTSIDYPNIYIYSNINDTQVRYTEPFKYYNKIKEASVFNSGEKQVLMKINMKYGHSQSSKRYESMEELAGIYNLIDHFIK